LALLAGKDQIFPCGTRRKKARGRLDEHVEEPAEVEVGLSLARHRPGTPGDVPKCFSDEVKEYADANGTPAASSPGPAAQGAGWAVFLRRDYLGKPRGPPPRSHPPLLTLFRQLGPTGNYCQRVKTPLFGGPRPGPAPRGPNRAQCRPSAEWGF